MKLEIMNGYVMCSRKNYIIDCNDNLWCCESVREWVNNLLDNVFLIISVLEESIK